MKLIVAISFLAGVAAQQQGSCEQAPDCTTCLAGKFGTTCGWCAVNTTSATAVGAHCADLKSTFQCNIQFQTDTCSHGYVCSNSTNGGKQCVPGIGGISDKAKCEEQCANPPPSPSPSPKGTYQCSFPTDVTAQPQCKPCNGTSGDCHYKGESDCSKDCAWKYECDFASLTCKQSKYGASSKSDCQNACHTIYECDEVSQTCKSANHSSPGKHPFPDQKSCAAECPAKPQPVPYEVRGIWRGLMLQNTYSTGEWLGNITNDSVTLWYPEGADYKLYIKGNASALAKPPQYVIEVDSVAGKLKGRVRLIAADYSMNPEVAGYINLAVDEAQLTQELPDFDTGMTKPSATVLGLESCPLGGPAPPPAPTPKPPPPTPPKPPPCHAKLDIVIVLDGSASITAADWQTALSFTNKVIDAFDIGADKVKIGVTQFSDTTETVISLSSDAAAIKKAVSGTRQMERNTNTGAGFESAETMIKTMGRATVDGKLCILITDGKPNRGPDPKSVSSRMKGEGIEIFGIGVGPGTDKAEIDSWVSTPVSGHSFQSTAWDQLHKILDQLVANACKHPPSPPPTRQLSELARVQAAVSSKCKFFLPANLPQSRRLQEMPQLAIPSAAAVAAAAVVEEPVAEEAGNVTDPCNPFATCTSCIGQRVQHSTCGWCTGKVTYEGKEVTAKCTGKEDGVKSKWTCEDRYQTSTCEAPASCGLEGIYRGLRIDNKYAIGEWSATFTPGLTKETATFEYLDPSGKAPTKMTGTMQCTKKCSEGTTQAGIPFTFTTTAGKIMHGICGYGNQVQAETTGLMLAMSNQGVATPPTSFDDAMPGTNATVYTYYKCSEFKKACKFNAP